jgi:hypothetical protein
MFSLFKQLLARGIAKDDMQIISETNHAENKDYVEIVLISFRYLVFSEPVIIQSTGWLGYSYIAYSYSDFLNGLQHELIKINSDSYIKAAINLISKCYYNDKDNKGHTLVSETNTTITAIIGLTEDIDVVDAVLLGLASLEGLNKIINKKVLQNKSNKGGKTIGGKRIDGKKSTHKFIKKSPPHQKNAKTTKKNKHFSTSAGAGASASRR